MIDKKEIYMNYKRHNKWLGIVDYKTLSIVAIYGLSIFYLLLKIQLSFKISVYIFSVLILPVVALTFVDSKNGSAIDILFIIIKYLLNKKIYVDMQLFYKKYSCKYKKINDV